MDDKMIERRLLILESMIADMYDAVVSEEKTRICPVCGEKVRLYLPVQTADGKNIFRRDVMCPACRSCNRHRAYSVFWIILNCLTKTALRFFISLRKSVFMTSLVR